MLNKKLRIVSVRGLKPEDEKLIYAFWQGTVYLWCKLRPNDWFALRDLMGQGIAGDPTDAGNFFWDGTPLMVLWNQQEKRYRLKEEPSDKNLKRALKQAAAKAGKLLKIAINGDQYHLFDTKVENITRKYLWIGTAPKNSEQESQQLNNDSDDERPTAEELISAFLQGAVYIWCKLRPNEWFALRDLMGKAVIDPSDDGCFFFNYTPLKALWEQEKENCGLNTEYSDEKLVLALKQTTIHADELLKKAIDNDTFRHFDINEEGMPRKYRWNRQAPKTNEQESQE